MNETRSAGDGGRRMIAAGPTVLSRSLPTMHPPRVRLVEPPRRHSASSALFACGCVTDTIFPLALRSLAGISPRTSASARVECGSEARLYVQRTARSGVEDLKDLKDLQGRSYSQLKTAFLYRSEYLPNCKCRPHPWETEAVQRHQVYSLTAAAAKGDENAAVELLALQNASEQPGEEGKAEQSERSSDRAVPPSERPKRKSRHTSKSGEPPQERRWLETIFQSTN